MDDRQEPLYQYYLGIFTSFSIQCFASRLVLPPLAQMISEADVAVSYSGSIHFLCILYFHTPSRPRISWLWGTVSAVPCAARKESPCRQTANGVPFRCAASLEIGFLACLVPSVLREMITESSPCWPVSSDFCCGVDVTLGELRWNIKGL
jgi:hypothetical protein